MIIFLQRRQSNVVRDDIDFYLNDKMDSSGRMNKTLSNVSEEQQSSNTIISVIPDLKVTNNKIHPFSPKEDADTTEFLIEGIIQSVYYLDLNKSCY